MTSKDGVTPHVSLVYGTVLDDGETLASPGSSPPPAPPPPSCCTGPTRRVPASSSPGASRWTRCPRPVRHLAVHAGHLVEVTEQDRPYVTPELVTAFTCTGSASEVRARIEAKRDEGVTEVAFQPAGPDIRRELESFRDAVRDL